MIICLTGRVGRCLKRLLVEDDEESGTEDTGGNVMIVGRGLVSRISQSHMIFSPTSIPSLFRFRLPYALVMLSFDSMCP